MTTKNYFERLFSACSSENIAHFRQELAKICPQSHSLVRLKAGCKVSEGSFSMLFVVQNPQAQNLDLSNLLDLFLQRLSETDLQSLDYCLEVLVEKNPKNCRLDFLFALPLESEKKEWAFQFSAKI